MSPLRLVPCAALLLVVACTSVEEGDPTVSQPPDTSAETMSLSYTLEPGTELVYDVDLRQRLSLTTEGEAAAVVDENLPATADVTVTAAGQLKFAISAGSGEGTYLVDIQGEFPDVTVEGIADGETVDDPDDIDQLGTIEPVVATVVIDPRGRLVTDGGGRNAPLAAGAPLTGLTGDLSQFVGPVLPEAPVAVGETWSETHSEPVLGDQPVERTVTGTLAGSEEVDGTETAVIETETSTAAAQVDLADFFGEFLTALAEESAEDAEDLDRPLEELVFRIAIDPSTSQATTWLDAEAGVVMRSSTSGTTHLVMAVALPDEDTGEIQRYDMTLDTEQSIDYLLLREPAG